MDMKRRTEYCGFISEKLVGQTVTLDGWVAKRRDHGGVIFIDLRDREGIMQVVFNPARNQEAFEIAEKLRSEYVIQVTGEVAYRGEGLENPNLKTGKYELLVDEVEVFSQAKTSPIYIDDEQKASEELRLKYRYLDIRRRPVLENLRLRHKTTKSIREYLDGEGYIDVETPILAKSTPEGARDYLVPSRVHEGSFYALPQSPQTFKQLLMGAGLDRYYQIVRCFRDEDLRGDRQPEFTQVDIETSFLSAEEIQEMMEGLLKKVMKDTLDVDVQTPFPRISFAEAMARYGNDKPDTRFDLELIDVSDIMKESDLKVFSSCIENGGEVKVINLKGLADEYSRKDADNLADFVSKFGAKGLAWIKVEEDGFSSSASKFLNDAELIKVAERCGSKPGDIIFIVSAQPKVVFDTLGWLRRKIAGILGLLDDNKFNFLWVVDFPMFEKDDEGNLKAMHHPFTQPKLDELDKLDGDILSLNADAYDIVLNGVELGGGSIRIHDRELQDKMFKVLGLGEEERMEKFGFFIEAFKYGAPPHAGLAYGLDRMVMLLLGESSIREVIAFPKNANAECPVSEAPGKADSVQLEELGLAVVAKHEQN